MLSTSDYLELITEVNLSSFGEICSNTVHYDTVDYFTCIFFVRMLRVETALVSQQPLAYIPSYGMNDKKSSTGYCD